METNAKDKIYIEGVIRFKQGLINDWQNTFTTVSSQCICVYTDVSKKVQIQRFKPYNSLVTASAKSETGLFVVNIATKLYLFETGSGELLRQWLSALNNSGWKTPNLNENAKTNKTFSLPLSSSINGEISLPLSSSINGGSFVRVEEHLNTSAMERSISMPTLVVSNSKESLISIDEQLENNGIQLYNLENNGIQLYNPLKPRDTRLKGSISESGYCSKESLLIENERGFYRPRRISRQENFSMTASDNNDEINERRKSMSLGRKTTPNDMGRYKLDYDNNLEEVFNEMQGDVILADIDDPDATPKLEKKPSMSQLILNLKSKFGSTSSRKKAKKGIKRVVRNDVYTGRLLWNPNGQWKDKWFHYQDGNLQGFKEVGFKPADVIINIKDCTLTSFTGDDMMKRLNLFKLTTAGDVVHTFAAWNEDDYEAWVECLSYAVQKKEEIHGLNMGVHNKPTSESDETYIIPYERALSNEDSQKTSTSSDNSTARVDSLDSGNDGDESGLESSHTSNQCKIKKANGTTEQNLMLQSFMNSRKENIPPNQQAKKASLRLDFTDSNKRYSAEVVKSNMSPTFEITPSSVGDLSKTTDFKRQKRPTSLNTKQRWSFYGSKKELNKMIVREHLQIPAKGQSNNIPLKTQSEEILSRDMDHVSVISQSGSLDSPSSFRPSSADSLLTHTPSSTDAPGFPNSWDGYRNYKKSMSEDEISDCCSMQSTSSIPMTEDHKQEELEDSLREETFLRKRRNSLTLERGEICTQIVALHDPPKKQNKNILPTAPIATENKKEIISKLESRLGHIDSQIEIIEKKISLTFNPIYKKSKTVKRNNAIISKLRGKPKPIDNTISMSVESLTSSGSRDSRDGQDLILHQDEYSIPENFVPAPRVKSQSTGGEMKKSDSKLSGFEELLLTTEKLEKSKGVKNKPLLNQPLSASDKWRSKSLGSMDLINLRQQQRTANANNQKYDHSLSNDNQCADESEKIIEDFERFSAILSNQMKMKRNIDIIQV